MYRMSCTVVQEQSPTSPKRAKRKPISQWPRKPLLGFFMTFELSAKTPSNIRRTWSRCIHSASAWLNTPAIRIVQRTFTLHTKYVTDCEGVHVTPSGFVMVSNWHALLCEPDEARLWSNCTAYAKCHENWLFRIVGGLSWMNPMWKSLVFDVSIFYQTDILQSIHP